MRWATELPWRNLTMIAKPSETTAPILQLLREGQHSTSAIAVCLGVQLNVVLFVKWHLKRGAYDRSPRAEKPLKPNSPRRDRGWTYLLVAECGALYVGATTDLRDRLRSHNSPTNSGWTRGRRWRLLGAVRFNSRGEAFDFEAFVKRRGDVRTRWVDESLPRAARLAARNHLSEESFVRVQIRAKCLSAPEAAPA